MQITDQSVPVRLLPLIEKSSNEGLANCLARLLVEDESQVADGARGALLILTGIQAFLDSDGDYRTVECLWEPAIVARQFLKSYGAEASKKAAEMSSACEAVNDERGEFIYRRVAELLANNNQQSH